LIYYPVKYDTLALSVYLFTFLQHVSIALFGHYPAETQVQNGLLTLFYRSSFEGMASSIAYFSDFVLVLLPDDAQI
jgi:hypothetical protein